jgi:hypothetical protein
MARILRDELQDTNPELATTFDRIYQESLKIWDEQYLREFTTHGRSHTEQVERNLDSLTRPLQKSAMALSAEEIFVLLSATCLHDIGMQRADDPEARSRHAQCAYDLILYSYARFESKDRRVTLPIDDRNARVAIANVARAHWTDYALELPEKEFVNDKNYEGRLKLLGLLLAMADLLDLSPVRARYFRSIHRLYDLPSVSGMHQKIHDLVKGIRVGPPKPNIPGALQFCVEWFDNSNVVRIINEWIMQWYNSQWLQLRGPLYEMSGGAIGWTEPWAKVIFHSPQGPVPTLTPAELTVLMAERADQLRINRNALATRFIEALKDREAIVFLFPSESDFDWYRLSEWCEAHARLQVNCRVARVSIRPSAPIYFEGIIRQIIDQWEVPLPEGSDDQATECLENFLTHDSSSNLVSIVRTDRLVDKSLESLLKILILRNNSMEARVCLLICPRATPPQDLATGSIFYFDGSSLPRAEIEEYLRSRIGLNSQEINDFYDKMLKLELTSHPAQVYQYIESHCMQRWEF